MIVAVCFAPNQGVIADLFREAVVQLQGHDDEVVVMVRDGFSVEGVPTIALSKRPSVLLASLRTLLSFRMDEPTVFVWSQHPAAVLALLIFGRKRVIAWWHEPTFRNQVGSIKRFAYFLYKIFVVKNAAQICVASNAIFDRVPAKEQRRTVVLPFPRLRGFATPSDRFLASPCELLFFGSLSPQKGLDVLAESLRLLRSRGDNLRLQIVGTGDLLSAAPLMHKLLMSSPATIRFAGEYMSEDDLASAIVNCSVVVMPYLSAAGSTSTSICSAIGKPIVASSVGSFRDEVIPDENGVLVPPNNPEALAAGILRALGRTWDIVLNDSTDWGATFVALADSL